MKLHANTNNVEKSGDFEESKFSIEASSKAFFILSDGLYSNKILAVIRELSTNAYDSHVDAGKQDVPFDVHLPTSIDPVFFIRDYGTSMNHDDCMQLYTTYFRSTRNDSNDAVGCLGLGSKAPFAYADSFTVEAYLNGNKRVYNAYKDENGNPVFSLMHECETTEQDGIKVSLQVDTHDIYSFNYEAKKVYEFFNVKPNFVGEQISFNNIEKVLAGSNWYFDDNANSNLIIMGQIAYPIDFRQLSDSDSSDDKCSNFIRSSDGLRIFMNIGDMDITPSRESLSYSAATKQNIKNVIKKIIEEITSKIEGQISEQPTLFKARNKYVQISDQCHSVKNAVESLAKSLSWNGKKLFDNTINETINVDKNHGIKMLHKAGYYRKKISSVDNFESISFHRNNKFVIDDIKRGGLSRVKKHMRELSSGASYYIYKLDSEETIDSNRLYDILGGATKEDVILTSSLPKVVYNRQTSSGESSYQAIHAQVYNFTTKKFEACSMSVKYENAIYFEESKETVSMGSTKYTVSPYTLGCMIDYIDTHYPEDIKDMSFYLVKPSVISNRNLKERDNWIEGVDIVRGLMQKAVKDREQEVLDYHNQCDLSSTRNDKFVDAFAMTKTDNEVKTVIAEYNEYKNRMKAIQSDMRTLEYAILSFAECKLSEDLTESYDNKEFSDRFDNLVNVRYPMLKVMVDNNPYGRLHHSHLQIIADYIDSVESSTKVLA